MPATAGDYFGVKYAGAIYGLMLIGWSLGGIIGPIIISALIGDDEGLHRSRYTVDRHHRAGLDGPDLHHQGAGRAPNAGAATAGRARSVHLVGNVYATGRRSVHVVGKVSPGCLPRGRFDRTDGESVL